MLRGSLAQAVRPHCKHPESSKIELSPTLGVPGLDPCAEHGTSAMCAQTAAPSHSKLGTSRLSRVSTSLRSSGGGLVWQEDL
jgi:hypothetical protein